MAQPNQAPPTNLSQNLCQMENPHLKQRNNDSFDIQEYFF